MASGHSVELIIFGPRKQGKFRPSGQPSKIPAKEGHRRYCIAQQTSFGNRLRLGSKAEIYAQIGRRRSILRLSIRSVEVVKRARLLGDSGTNNTAKSRPK